MILIDKTFKGKDVFAQKGDVIEIQLEENPTTGYVWAIKSINDKHLNFLEKKFRKSVEAVGAGGVVSFFVEVIGEGISELHFSFGRPWKQEKEDSFHVIIIVK